MSIDQIVCAGHAVDLRTVERRLVEHPAVLEAVVVGKPDALRGESVKAFVVLRSGFVADEELEDQLGVFVQAQLSIYAAPRDIVFLKRLPKSANGKIQRSVLHTGRRSGAL